MNVEIDVVFFSRLSLLSLLTPPLLLLEHLPLLQTLVLLQLLVSYITSSPCATTIAISTATFYCSYDLLCSYCCCVSLLVLLVNDLVLLLELLHLLLGTSQHARQKETCLISALLFLLARPSHGEFVCGCFGV